MIDRAGRTRFGAQLRTTRIRRVRSGNSCRCVAVKASYCDAAGGSRLA